jgi:hypothetical protein
MPLVRNAPFAKLLYRRKDTIYVTDSHPVSSSEALDPQFVFKMLHRVIYLGLAAFAVSKVKCSKTHAFDRNMVLHKAETEWNSGDWRHGQVIKATRSRW